MRTVEFSCTDNNTEINARVREFEGVGRAEYSSLDNLTIIAAKALVIELSKAIFKAEENKTKRDAARAAQLRADIEKSQQELERLLADKPTKFAGLLTDLTDSVFYPQKVVGEVGPQGTNTLGPVPSGGPVETPPNSR